MVLLRSTLEIPSSDFSTLGLAWDYCHSCLSATFSCKRYKLTFFTIAFSVNETSKDKREFFHDQKTKVVAKERKSEGLLPNKPLHK